MQVQKKENSHGDDLLSREVALQVPSALAGLTTGFGMEPGISPPLTTPENSLSEKSYLVGPVQTKEKNLCPPLSQRTF